MTQTIQRTIERLYGWRLMLLIPLHVALIVLSNQAAFWLRFDGTIPADQQPIDTELLPLLIAVRMAAFVPLRLHEGVWRYAGIWDLKNIILGVAFSSLAFWGIVHGVLGIMTYPRSVFIIDALLLIFLTGGVRFARRFHSLSTRRSHWKRVLIYGAGDAGEMIARDMLRHEESQALPIGFLDDNPAKHGSSIHGIPVIGGAEALPRALDRLRPDEILIAMPAAEPKVLRRIVDAIEACKLPLKTLPRLQEIGAGGVTMNAIRDLSVVDLLARSPVGLDARRVQHLIDGQIIIVTGAGGSIGSELCRQVAACGPAQLLMLDRYENGLFAIHTELAKRFPSLVMHTIVADVTDTLRLDQVFAAHRPNLVFHAAAHKHVPLMETNPCEAVKNNVRGTRLLAEAAIRGGVSRFVMISTDKAVNPSSVMGATKRVAELIVKKYSEQATTRFSIVRFGNVLGSNGSVVPTFVEQIKAGGPVTVTHPEMRRYFMLIPEAVQLVLHAAAIGENGGTYVLDMGEQVRVVDMARHLIRLAGYRPDEDIEITFTGIRDGEKLFEELVAADESAVSSEVEKVQRVITTDAIDALFDRRVRLIEMLAMEGNAARVLGELREFMPTLTAIDRQRLSV